MKSRVGQLLSFYFPNTIRLYTVCNNSSVTADEVTCGTTAFVLFS
jgi:hypothetical protein